MANRTIDAQAIEALRLLARRRRRARCWVLVIDVVMVACVATALDWVSEAPWWRLLIAALGIVMVINATHLRAAVKRRTL